MYRPPLNLPCALLHLAHPARCTLFAHILYLEVFREKTASERALRFFLVRRRTVLVWTIRSCAYGRSFFKTDWAGYWGTAHFAGERRAPTDHGSTVLIEKHERPNPKKARNNPRDYNLKIIFFRSVLIVRATNSIRDSGHDQQAHRLDRETPAARLCPI